MRVGWAAAFACAALIAAAALPPAPARQRIEAPSARLQSVSVGYEAAQKAERRKRTAFVILSLGGILTVVLAVIGRHRRPPDGGFVPGLFAAWTFVTGTLVGFAALTFIMEGDRLGYGAYLLFAVLLYSTPALLLGWICLAAAMVQRKRRTVIRMAGLGFGLTALLLAAFWL